MVFLTDFSGDFPIYVAELVLCIPSDRIVPLDSIVCSNIKF